MSIQDSAYDGSLTRSQLQRHISTNPSSLNEIGGNIDLTPLCAACLGGHLDIVKHLLSFGADPNVVSSYERTPLFYITDPRSKASSATRCAIIRELVSGKSGLKANLDAPCDDDKNTPLMNVIMQLKDKTLIQELVESGASLTVRYYPNQKTAKELGEEHDLARSLVSKAERDMEWAKLIDIVVTFVLLIVQYVNNKTVTNVVGGVVKKYYDMSVKDEDVPKDLQEEVAPKTLDEFKDFLNDEVQQGKFEKFFSPNDPFLTNLAENLCEKANALRDDPTTDLGKPENIKRLTQLSLYRTVIYCDDSSSMSEENRYEYLIELVIRIARIATKIVPDNMARVDLRFINNNFASNVSGTEVLQTMRKVWPSGVTEIGTNLRNKILKPLVYDIIDSNTSATPIPFKRPLLVCIITDGHPVQEGRNVLRDEIVRCKRKLEAKGYDPTSVMYCINQVGTDPEAEHFIDALRVERTIEEVIYCTVGQLDAKYEELKENERALESWLLELLTKPIMGRHVPV